MKNVIIFSDPVLLHTMLNELEVKELNLTSIVGRFSRALFLRIKIEEESALHSTLLRLHKPTLIETGQLESKVYGRMP